MLIGRITRLLALTRIIHKTRPSRDDPGQRIKVENEDIAHALVEFESGTVGILASSRVAHGRKNGIKIEVHGSKGTMVFDQERMNELQLFLAGERTETAGFRTILAGPQHPPYGLFCLAPGHCLGFNDLKVIEVAHLLKAIMGQEKPFLTFEDGAGYRKGHPYVS
jgi:predicted dehydrogenase